MSKSAAPERVDWREGRRQSARDAIVDAAWQLVRDEGLAALSMRDLAMFTTELFQNGSLSATVLGHVNGLQLPRARLALD